MARWKWLERNTVTDPRQLLAREETRLWIWITAVTILTLVALALSLIPLPAHAPYPALHLRYEQVTPALLVLLLLFNLQMLRRRWSIRRARKDLTAAQRQNTDHEVIPESAGIDPVTGLGNRRAAEVQLGKEIAVARRRGEPLSLLIIGLENFAAVQNRIGRELAERVLCEFAEQLRRATRGSDFPVRFGNDEFLAVLPGCALGDVQRVVNRLEPLTVEIQGEEVTIDISTGWLDPQAGETPEGLLKRAQEMLRLYKDVDAAAHTPARAT